MTLKIMQHCMLSSSAGKMPSGHPLASDQGLHGPAIDHDCIQTIENVNRTNKKQLQQDCMESTVSAGTRMAFGKRQQTCRFLHTWLWRWASNVGTLSGIE
eukprot:3419030-Amphidinium_carterae.1